MGWASGGEVFDPIATKLINLNASDIVMFEICSTLIRGLQERGWDTEAESLGEFQDYPEIVAAFAACGIEMSEGQPDERGAPHRDAHRDHQAGQDRAGG